MAKIQTLLCPIGWMDGWMDGLCDTAPHHW
jgi:hypothetical protein